MNPIVDAAAKVDFAFLIIFVISVAVLALVTGLMLWFLWRYHHTRHPEAENVRESVWLEVMWTLIPTILALGMFWFGWDSFKALQSAPEDALEVRVEGRMWSWAFIYDNGRRSNVLYVPVDTPVKLTMTSTDVLHSFYVPAFRIKRDTVPGMNTYAWFRPEEAGDYDILCAEYCGLKHANMLSVVRVVSDEEFGAWYTGETDTKAADKGKALLEEYGCVSCHSLDGSDGVGPTLKNIYGTTRQVVKADGTEAEVVADKPYLRRALLDPNAEVVKGYQAMMPGYDGVIPEEDLLEMVNWMANQGAMTMPMGRSVAEGEGCLSCHSTDGSEIAGPTFKNLYGSTVAVLRDGVEEQATADEAYLREAILEPEAVISKGYQPIMPPYGHLSEDDLSALVDWLKSLSKAGG